MPRGEETKPQVALVRGFPWDRAFPITAEMNLSDFYRLVD